MPTLTALEAPYRAGKRRVLHIDGDPWRTTSVDALRGLALAEGDDVVEEELLQALLAAEPKAMHARALRILDARDRSAGELKTRLLEDGYPEETVATLVARFSELALVDDARLAEALVGSLRDRKGYGRHRVRRELTRRQISPEVADEALDSDACPDSEDDRALAAAERLALRTDDRRRLVERLVRRGYDWETARRAVSRLAKDPLDPLP